MSVSPRRVETVEAAPIILVPGFWLGAWAWDEVVDLLRADGHDVTALTLPGLESVDADRSSISLNDHVEAIAEAVRGAGRPVVLAVHSGAGASGYAATDRVPELIAEMVYVDSGPPSGALDAGMEDTELPLPSAEDLAAEENLDGLSDQQLETFRRRAIPEPAGPIRDAPELRNDARLDVPTTVICTGFTSEQVKGAVEQGQAWIAALAELRDVSYVDLPTSHWPMWSRPKELAEILSNVASAHTEREGNA
jgi:pimeloyl-ACP methyl ester carboxylesterase